MNWRRTCEWSPDHGRSSWKGTLDHGISGLVVNVCGHPSCSQIRSHVSNVGDCVPASSSRYSRTLTPNRHPASQTRTPKRSRLRRSISGNAATMKSLVRAHDRSAGYTPTHWTPSGSLRSALTWPSGSWFSCLGVRGVRVGSGSLCGAPLLFFPSHSVRWRSSMRRAG